MRPSSIDRTAWPNLFISYYTYGQAIGLGLDLSLRDRSNGKMTRRRLHEGAVGAGSAGRGRRSPARSAPRISIDGLKETLATVSGDRELRQRLLLEVRRGPASWSITRALLARAGLVMRKRARRAGVCRPGAAAGRRRRALRVTGPRAVGVAALQGRRRAGRSAGQPRWHGADVDGELGSGARAAQARRSRAAALRAPQRRDRQHHAGARRRIRASRSCRWKRSAASLTDDQKRFRESWLGSLQDSEAAPRYGSVAFPPPAWPWRRPASAQRSQRRRSGTFRASRSTS